MKKLLPYCLLIAVGWACEKVDTLVPEEKEPAAVPLEEVAQLLSSLPLGYEQFGEVHSAVQGSAGNGYDSEYTMRDLFADPGRSVGESTDPASRAATKSYSRPLRALIDETIRSRYATKASTPDPYGSADAFLGALSDSDIQIYWPYVENWNGTDAPIITYDPADGATRNIGWKREKDGSLREVIVDEQMALEQAVWVVNRNDDAAFKTAQVLRRENPEWGQGGAIRVKSPDEETAVKTLLLKEFTARRAFDTWFAGASEFFIKCGSLEDFTASTEAEMLLYSPTVTDFMIVVKRSDIGKAIPFNALLVSDWTEQLESCAFLITEDDGGTMTNWKCSANVKVNSKSYGFDLSIPLHSRDDIVWRGQLTRRYFEKYDNLPGHFGDVDLTFEIQ